MEDLILESRALFGQSKAEHGLEQLMEFVAICTVLVAMARGYATFST